MSDHLKGLLLTSAGVMAIVPDSIFVRLIEAPHMTIVFWRAAFATLALFAGLAFTYGTALPRVVMALGRAGAAYALLFSLGTGLFVLAVQLTTIAKAVLIVSGTPVFAALLSWRFMGEPLSRRMGWTIAVTMAGVAIITFGGDGGARANALAGELCALGTALAMAGALTLARANRHISMVPAAAPPTC